MEHNQPQNEPNGKRKRGGFFNLCKTPQKKEKKELVEPQMSLYADDMQFYRDLFAQLEYTGSVKNGDVTVVEGDRPYIEIGATDELKGVLYDMPSEACQKRTYKLCNDKDVVMQYISASRKKKDSGWSEMQVLYDLHPIIHFMLTKLWASMPKEQAFVVKHRMFRTGFAYFVFYGSVANGKGQNLLSKFFVIPMNIEKGTLAQKPMSFADFLSDHPDRLNKIYPEEIQKEDLDQLQNLLQDAIALAETEFMIPRQDELAEKMTQKLNQYKKHLTTWEEDAKNGQLSLISQGLEIEPSITRKGWDGELVEIETICKKESAYYQDIFTIDNVDPYLKILAVFYNK